MDAIWRDARYRRRAEIGHHHHVAGAYLVRYAQESAWPEANRADTQPSPDHRGALIWRRHVAPRRSAAL
jgi:hypothetical protein